MDIGHTRRNMVVKTRIKIPGPALTFITNCVKDRIPIFRSDNLARMVASQLKETIEYYEASMVGWVLMPSHFHALVGIKKADRLSRFMQSFKILSSKKAKRILSDKAKSLFMNDGRFNFWMPGFDEFTILSENQFRMKLHYIHYNPVRAGIVPNACDYVFSSAVDWLGNGMGLIPIDKEYKWCG